MKFLVNAAQMNPDGLDADVEAVGDLLVGEALGEVLEDLGFAFGEFHILDLVGGGNGLVEGLDDVLVRLRATGRLGLAERSALMAAAARVAPDFALFDLRDGDLATAVEVADLDAIDRAGALRLAAEELQADGSKVATDALARLYAFVTEDAP